MKRAFTLVIKEGHEYKLYGIVADPRKIQRILKLLSNSKQVWNTQIEQIFPTNAANSTLRKRCIRDHALHCQIESWEILFSLGNIIFLGKGGSYEPNTTHLICSLKLQFKLCRKLLFIPPRCLLHKRICELHQRKLENSYFNGPMYDFRLF